MLDNIEFCLGWIAVEIGVILFLVFFLLYLDHLKEAMKRDKRQMAANKRIITLLIILTFIFLGLSVVFNLKNIIAILTLWMTFLVAYLMYLVRVNNESIQNLLREEGKISALVLELSKNINDCVGYIKEVRKAKINKMIDPKRMRVPMWKLSKIILTQTIQNFNKGNYKKEDYESLYEKFFQVLKLIDLINTYLEVLFQNIVYFKKTQVQKELKVYTEIIIEFGEKIYSNSKELKEKNEKLIKSLKSVKKEMNNSLKYIENCSIIPHLK